MKWIIPAAIALCAGPAFAQEAPAEDVMVVLDASGSMWGRIGDRTKIDIVREAYGNLITKWEANSTRSGLIVYGHRRKGDCSDIELMSRPGQSDAQSLGRTVNKLNPKGKTPLGAAVKLAADELRFTENKATVVLLSDGLETCGVQTCELARNLEELGIDFTAHVIGLGLSQADQDQLRCLAIETGGEFLNAGSADQLEDAFQQVTDLTGFSFQGLLADTGEAVPDVSWVLRNEAGEDVASAETDGSSLTLEALVDYSLPPGAYTITAMSGDYAGSSNFSVPADERTVYVRLFPDVPATTLTYQAPIRAGTSFEVSWVGKGGDDDTISIVPKGGSWDSATDLTYVRSGNPVTLKAPGAAGLYDLLYLNNDRELNREDARITVEVVETTYSLEPTEPIWAGNTFSVRWRGPGAEGDMIAIGPRTSSTDDYSNLRWIDDDDVVELRAPDEPGEYELRYFGDGYELRFVQPVIVQ